MGDRKTIFALKLRSSRHTRDYWLFAVIIAAVLLVIAMIGAAQVAVCASTHLTWTVIQCLTP